MSTNASISLINGQTGEISTIYSHWDGYPAYVGSILAHNYQSADKIKTLLNLGSISTLGIFPKNSPLVKAVVRKYAGDINTDVFTIFMKLSSDLTDHADEIKGPQQLFKYFPVELSDQQKEYYVKAFKKSAHTGMSRIYDVLNVEKLFTLNYAVRGDSFPMTETKMDPKNLADLNIRQYLFGIQLDEEFNYWFYQDVSGKSGWYFCKGDFAENTVVKPLTDNLDDYGEPQEEANDSAGKELTNTAEAVGLTKDLI